MRKEAGFPSGNKLFRDFDNFRAGSVVDASISVASPDGKAEGTFFKKPRPSTAKYESVPEKTRKGRHMRV